MSFGILCPAGGDHALVPPSGTICVCGSISEDVWISSHILVRILSNWVDPPQSPWPATPADAVGVILGQNWYAINVPVPSWSAAGVQITVAAWLVTGGGGSGSGVGTTSAPEYVWCYAGGAPPVDTCATCASGSGDGQALLAGRRILIQELEISVPATLHAGFSGGPADLNALTLTLEHIGLVDGHLTWRSNPFRVGSMSSAATLDLVCGRTQPGAWLLSAANGLFQAPAKGAAPVISYWPVFALTFSGIRLNPDWGKGTIAITVTP